MWQEKAQYSVISAGGKSLARYRRSHRTALFTKESNRHRRTANVSGYFVAFEEFQLIHCFVMDNFQLWDR